MSLVHETDYGTPRSKAQKTVTLTIDGQSVTVPEGTSIMRAAMEMGTQIPKLCATDMLDAFGSCRLCLVEIEGRAGTPASCTTPVAAGMAVRTQTERLKRLRKGVMELYISDHPLDCLTCAANGDCELQDMAGAVGLRDVRYGYAGDKHPNPGKDESNPYFTYDPSKCIVCSRCVRACEEVQGTFALTIAGRGFSSVVSPGMEESFLASECVSCGACVQACPTATLTEKSVIEIGQPEHSVVTTCAYCGVGCAFKAEMRGDEVVRMVPYKDGKANRGHSCVKGRFAWGYATHRERILKPMIREKITDPWREVSLGRGDRAHRVGIQAHPGEIRPALDRRHHLVALHQRRDLPGAEADPRRLRQQQCRHLRAGLPLADRLWPEHGVRDLGRHPGLRFGRADRRRHADRRQSDRRPSGVRLAHEEAPAPGREADRDRSAPHRSRAHAPRRGRASPAAAAGHQCRGADRARPCHRDRRPRRRGLRARALRLGRVPGLGGVRLRAAQQPGGGGEDLRRSGARRSAPRPASMPPAATARSTTASASPSTARARPR